MESGLRTLVASVLASGGVLCAALAAPARSDAQRPTEGWRVAGVPALNYNSDDKFGYGAILEFYRYGADTTVPYALNIQPTVFRTTGGRRDYTLFVDAPRVRGSRWRVSVFAGQETHSAAPYYGVGNDTRRNESLEEPPNEKYYRFGRERVQLLASAVARVARTRLHVVTGAGATHTRIDEIPRGTAATLLDTELAGAPAREGWTRLVRAGLAWDSRDREVHTRRGTWTDVLVQRSDTRLGADWSFTRTTLTARKYIPLTPRLTLAERILVQNVSGDVPFHELAVIQTYFRPQEGLGGSSSVRGLPRSRYLGKGLALANSELRWRAAERRVVSLTLSAFADIGRVWRDGVDFSTITSDLKVGVGAGARVGVGPNFVVALDVGHSRDAAAPIYLGLGFLF